MPINQCAKCRNEGRVLEELSRGAAVDYYRCDYGHVWTVVKNGPIERWDVTTEEYDSTPHVENRAS